MRKILVPTDFSKNAFVALKYACKAFKHEVTEIFIVHAYTVALDGKAVMESDTFQKLKAKSLKESELQLRQVLAQIKAYVHNPQHNYYIASSIGTLADVTNDLVDKENIDILVMGTRGETNDRLLTFGSNALELMKHEHCPVLVIPENYEYRAPKQVLFPTDFGVPNKRRELKLLSDMMVSFRSTITFLYINPEKEMNYFQKNNKDFLYGFLGKLKLFFETTHETDKTLAITKYIIGDGFEMLIIVNDRLLTKPPQQNLNQYGTQTDSYLDEVLPQPQSTQKNMGLQVKIPILVLQNIAR